MMVIAALVLASFGVYGYTLRVEQSEADRRERDVARQAAVATDLLLVQGIAGLRGARGLVDELGFVDPDGFDAFAGALEGAPGLEGVFLVRRVPRDQRALFEVEIGQKIRGLTPSGELVPAPSRPVHYAVERVAPPGSSLGKLLGVDLLFGARPRRGHRDGAHVGWSGADRARRAGRLPPDGLPRHRAALPPL